jgi:transposase-like protein
MPKRTRKSYTAETKLKILAFAEIHGYRAAGREFDCDDKSIREWRNDKEVLKVLPKNKRARRGRSAVWPEIEDYLKAWIIEKRSKDVNRRVNTIDIRLEAMKFANQNQISNFKGTSKWCYNFMKRHNLSVRATNSVGQNLPNDWEAKVAEFKTFIRKDSSNIHSSQIGNFDEVPVSFDMPGNYTVDFKGTKHIKISTNWAEKSNFTVVLCITADENKCDPFVIFKRKTIPEEVKDVKGIIVCANPKGWMNEDVIKVWCENVWAKRKHSFFTKKEESLLIFDSAKCHLTDVAKKEVKKYSKIAVIPAGLTSKLQPLDLTVNKSFKSKLRNEWEKWMVNGPHYTTKSGKQKRPSYKLICEWIVRSWDQITPENVKNGFRNAHIRDYTSIETVCDSGSDTEIDEDINLIGLSDEAIDNLKSFNIVSDEEFDGFESD